ncbi:hypothetical protein [Caballeronia sp. ATUFL_F1_KS39]|uniref:hypothetical protein n=1 Tax=Caballeronia sp. ATUFL_F1_KS39 TaxID=2921766 RepID=UPI0020279920|nr:hypothetical protein [Caballeronia sp. ATUFL_F1_KS39]
MTAIRKGTFVHVVAIINTKMREGRILYVNPSTSTVASDAPASDSVQLVVLNDDGHELYREAVVVRRSSCSCESPQDDVGLVQADLPRLPGMKSVLLTIDNKEADRYHAGTALVQNAANLVLSGASPEAPHRRTITLAQAAELKAESGVTYSVQVKADNGAYWNTIAVGRPVPQVDIDRNQFSGARKADVRVLRTTGFDEDVIAQETIDLF